MAATEARVIKPPISGEQYRILWAAHNRLFGTNDAGRYVIWQWGYERLREQARPRRRERERLVKRGMLEFRVVGEDTWWEPSARGYQAMHEWHLDHDEPAPPQPTPKEGEGDARP